MIASRVAFVYTSALLSKLDGIVLTSHGL